MNTIYVNHFKAFTGSGIQIDISERKNLILYGENGSGKSSLFEALKLIFYRDRIFSSIPDTTVGPAYNAAVQQILQKYRHRSEPTIPSFIQINGIDYDSTAFSVDPYEVFFISYADLKYNDQLSLDSLLDKIYFPSEAKDNVDTYWSNDFIQEINKILHDDFFEDLVLHLEQGEGHRFRLSSSHQGLNEYDKLYQSFNEASVHLVVLIILLQIVELCSNSNKKRILVLDDIITSLDATNRGLVIKYLITHFKEYQRIIFTHNVSFFNLFRFVKNTYTNHSELTHRCNQWEEKTLYIIHGSPVLSTYTGNDETQTIENELAQPNCDLENIGNRIRKRFETLLYEFASLIQFGDFQEASHILECLMGKKDKYIYLTSNQGKIKNIYDMLSEIENKINSSNNHNIKDNIKHIIAEYKKNDELRPLVDIMRDLKIYQKIVLHQLSHAQNGLTTFSLKEIKASILLLKKMEIVVNKGRNVNTVGNVYTL